MKLLVLSHACVVPINQQFFAEIENQTGWEVTIIVPTKWKNDYGKVIKSERWDKFQGKIINIPVLFSGSIPLHMYWAWFIPLLKQLKPDAIYVQHEPYALATMQIYMANALSVRKPITFLSWQNIFKSYPFLFRQIENFVYQQSFIAFPGSSSVENVLRQKGFRGDCQFLPYAADPSIYFPRADVSDLRAKWQIREDEVVVGYLGRIIEEKGFKTLLHALALIVDLPRRLVIVGTGDYEDQVDQIASQLGIKDRVLKLGFIPHNEAPRYLSAFDMLVLPSETQANWKEQFGRVIIEAMACGTPVIGSDSGEIPYLIKKTGGGVIFPESNSEELANRLRQLIANKTLRQELAEQGQKSVSTNYTNASITKRFIDVFSRFVT